MPGTTIFGDPLPSVPGQDRPAGSSDVVWRDDIDYIRAHPSRPLGG